MIESIFNHLAGITALILFIWSAALVWASLQIRCMIRALDEERQEIRRWKRLAALHQSQKVKWQ